MTSNCSGIYEDKWMWIVPAITLGVIILWVLLVSYILKQRREQLVRPADPPSSESRPHAPPRPNVRPSTAVQPGLGLNSNSPVHVCNSKAAWDNLRENAGPSLIVVHFSTEWCEPSKSIRPKFAHLARENPDCVFAQVDAEVNQPVSTKYEVTSIPTFQFFRSGEKVDEVVGANYNKVVIKLQKYKW